MLKYRLALLMLCNGCPVDMNVERVAKMIYGCISPSSYFGVSFWRVVRGMRRRARGSFMGWPAPAIG